MDFNEYRMQQSLQDEDMEVAVETATLFRENGYGSTLKEVITPEVDLVKLGQVKLEGDAGDVMVENTQYQDGVRVRYSPEGELGYIASGELDRVTPESEDVSKSGHSWEIATQEQAEAVFERVEALDEAYAEAQSS
jgi:hypothetical protein